MTLSHYFGLFCYLPLSLLPYLCIRLWANFRFMIIPMIVTGIRTIVSRSKLMMLNDFMMIIKLFVILSKILLYSLMTLISYFEEAAFIAPKQCILTTRFSSVSDMCCSVLRYGSTYSGRRLPRTRNISGASILTLSSTSCRSFS